MSYDNYSIVIFNDSTHTQQQFYAILANTFTFLNDKALKIACALIHRSGSASLHAPLEKIEYFKEKLEGYGFKCQIERRSG
jgi:ATP-dependent Clp protease adapter protein ClpS